MRVASIIYLTIVLHNHPAWLGLCTYTILDKLKLCSYWSIIFKTYIFFTFYQQNWTEFCMAVMLFRKNLSNVLMKCLKSLKIINLYYLKKVVKKSKNLVKVVWLSMNALNLQNAFIFHFTSVFNCLKLFKTHHCALFSVHSCK